MNRSERQQRNAQMRAYKAEGRTNKEVAEVFGVSEGTAASACRGIASQCAEGSKKLTVENNLEKYEEYARGVIAEKAPGFEYVSGYTGSDGKCLIECKTCGTTMTKSFITIRHGKARCAVCDAARREAKRVEREEAKAKERETREAAQAEKKKAREEEKRAAQEQREAMKHPCVICGRPTLNKYCCSEACSKKRLNQQHEVKRLAKIQNATVDKDITLQKLFMRDSGRCYLCGGLCDWSDKEERGGVTICGNTYPSIDHVIPLAKGGAHAWDNVKLAHRLCNTCKRDKIIPLTV